MDGRVGRLLVGLMEQEGTLLEKNRLIEWRFSVHMIALVWLLKVHARVGRLE